MVKFKDCASECLYVVRLGTCGRRLTIFKAWRQDRLDLAKLMLAKIKSSPENIGPCAAEDLADTLFGIGNSQTENSEDAVFWFQTAYDVLLDQNSDALSSDAGELQISIMHTLARTLLRFKHGARSADVGNIIQKLELESVDRLAVLLLKLDHLATDPEYSPQVFSDVLQKIIRTAPLSDINVKMILNQVHKLSSRSPPLAHTVLAVFLSERLLVGDQPKWFEKALVTIIWNGTIPTEQWDSLSSLRKLFDRLAAGNSTLLTASATHAAQILLWKRIETSYNQILYDNTAAWCQLSLHGIFSNSGPLNVGKLERKMMLCALGTSVLARALEVYSQMSAVNQKDPATQYLLYKVALRSQDTELARDCLETIYEASTKDDTLLYACVLEAQKVGDHSQSIASLQRVLEKYSYSAPPEIHLPALLRCTARLLMREIDKPESFVRGGINEICKLFEGAANRARISQGRSPNNFSFTELDWFSRNIYNLALKVCTSWEPRQTLRLSQACLNFIDLYPITIDEDTTADLSLRRLFCDFLNASLLIILARAADIVQDQVLIVIDLSCEIALTMCSSSTISMCGKRSMISGHTTRSKMRRWKEELRTIYYANTPVS